MLIPPLPSLLDATPALAVLESSSRFLLTLGVGLFIAYAICMLGANILGVAHRRVSTLRSPSNTPESVEQDVAQGQHASIVEMADTPVALKQKIL